MGSSLSDFARKKYVEYGGQITDTSSTVLYALACDFQIGWSGRIKHATGQHQK